MSKLHIIAFFLSRLKSKKNLTIIIKKKLNRYKLVRVYSKIPNIYFEFYTKLLSLLKNRCRLTDINRLNIF